jgi:hypothetical protein
VASIRSTGLSLRDQRFVKMNGVLESYENSTTEVCTLAGEKSCLVEKMPCTPEVCAPC